MIYTLLAALQLLAKQNKNSLGLFYLLFTNLEMCSWIKNSFMTKLYENELIILINASTQLFFPVKHMKSLSGKDYFISTFQNYWEIIHIYIVIHVYDKWEDIFLDRWTKLRFLGEVIK